jgi:hypothetical protein
MRDLESPDAADRPCGIGGGANEAIQRSGGFRFWRGFNWLRRHDLQFLHDFAMVVAEPSSIR